MSSVIGGHRDWVYALDRMSTISLAIMQQGYIHKGEWTEVKG
jgi:hypothetical protein